MKYKNFFLYILVFFLNFYPLFAQEHGNDKTCERRKEKIKAEKVTFLSTKLDLNVKEAQNFWAIYNEYEKNKEDLHQEKRTLMSKIRNEKTALSDKELENIVDRLVEIQLEEANCMKDYYTKIKKVLPIKKVLKCYGAEMQFRKHLLKKIGKHRHRD